MKSADQIQQRARENPNHLAIDGSIGKLTYEELDKKAKSVAQNLRSGLKSRKIALWGQKSLDTYASLLGVHYAGHSYTPFLPNWPKERLLAMAQMLELKEIIYSSGDTRDFVQLCQLLNNSHLKVYVHEEDIKKEFQQLGLDHEIQILNEGRDDISYLPENKSLAYVLFTSGSTGQPKGVPISFGNLNSYLKNFQQHYKVQTDDRLSHTFELSFDLSVHDIFVAWTSGATLCVPSHEDLMFPHNYILQQNLSTWFSVPTLAGHMQKLGLFEHFSFPDLKQSFFCGEPLFEETARIWQKAAPNSSVVNLYGPTEATIAYTHYKLPPKAETPKVKNSILSLGRPFDGLNINFLNEELILIGEQVTSGYLKNLEKTNSSFFKNENQENCYRTGDRCQLDQDGDLFFIARVDHQVKIHGHRIELFEIEAVIKEVTGKQHCYCVALKDEFGSAQSIVAAVDKSAPPSERLLSQAQEQKIRECLPSYMIPKTYFGLDTFPTNASGKIDRKEIEKILISPSFKDGGK